MCRPFPAASFPYLLAVPESSGWGTPQQKASPTLRVSGCPPSTLYFQTALLLVQGGGDAVAATDAPLLQLVASLTHHPGTPFIPSGNTDQRLPLHPKRGRVGEEKEVPEGAIFRLPPPPPGPKGQ